MIHYFMTFKVVKPDFFPVCALRAPGGGGVQVREHSVGGNASLGREERRDDGEYPSLPVKL